MRIVQSPELEAVEASGIPDAWDVPWRFFLEAPREAGRFLVFCACGEIVIAQLLPDYARSRIYAGQCASCKSIYWTRRL